MALLDHKLQVFQNSPKLTIFGIFDKLMSTKNVHGARFACNVEWDFFYYFQTQWIDLLKAPFSFWNWILNFLPLVVFKSWPSSFYCNTQSILHLKCNPILFLYREAKLRRRHGVWKLPKMSHFNFSNFSPIIVLLKVTCLVILFDCKLQVF